MRYEPEGLSGLGIANPPLEAYLAQELRRITGAFLSVEELLLVNLHVEPSRPRDGMIKFADGSDWNPGSGRGFYGRANSVWIPFNHPSVVTTLANDATPTVLNVVLAKTGGTTTITDFDDGVVGQTFRLLSAHAVTITDATNILLNGSGNFVMAAGDVLTLTMFNDQVWEEVSRKVN